MPKLAQKSFKKVYFRTSFTLDLQSYICYNNRVKASKKWSITGQYLNLEIRARKEVLRKIENAYKRLKKQAEANYEKRKAKAQYKSIEEAHDAWGYDCITEQEYNEIVKIFELGAEYVEKHLSPQEVAVKILGEFMGRLSSEIRSFVFDLLPSDEQVRLLREKDEWQEKLNVRECTNQDKRKGGSS